MTLNTEQLREKAHESALQHDPFISGKASNQFQKKNEAHIEEIRAFAKQLQNSQATCSQPAEEWLLDNAEFLEEQALVIKNELTKQFMNSLPHLKKTNESRILSICTDYLKYTDGNLNKASLIEYIHSYQEVSVLKLAEIWATPLIMRVALIRYLAETMKIVKERHNICSVVDNILSRIETTEITPEKLKQALLESGYEMPLSGPMIVHLIKHLRERADYSATVGEWLICKLENGPESLDHILSYEYQLQASFQVTTGNLISSLRKLSRWNWRETFEDLSIVEQTLRKENAGCYPKLDFSSRDTLRKTIEKLATRLRMPENLVAIKALELANEFEKDVLKTDNEDMPRQAFVSYYLLEPEGLKALRHQLKICGKPKPLLLEMGFNRRSTSSYLTVVATLFVTTLLGLSLLIGWDRLFTPIEWIVIGIILILPASEWAVTGVHWMIERVKKPLPLLRYDFSKKVPDEATTMVVVPIIWSTVEEVKELSERLELHSLANRDSNIHFALLGDFKDSKEESAPEDDLIIKAAREEIDRLSKTYPERRFHLFLRKRLWNPSENVWMGWERKRGKLVEFVELLKGKMNTSYNVIEGDVSFLERVKYIITLDADTQLPLESAQRMIGTLHLPFNRPRLNENGSRVVEGYGVLQPRIAMSHEAAMRSRFAALWSAEPGIDPYAFAVSDPYQDGMGQGIFTGKGIFDVDTFYQILCDRIPENRLLSHDLLEGGFLRAGLLSDIELVDDHPSRFISHQKRFHRWVRGDWQLLLWLLPRARNRRGEVVPVDLSILTRWQIIDNLRRSLLPPVYFAALLLAFTLLPGSPLIWFSIVLATIFLPVIKQIVSVKTLFYHTKGVGYTIAQVLLSIITLPFQTVLLIDAISRTLYRLFFSKKRLLEWVPAAEVDRNSKRNALPLTSMYSGYVLIFVFLGAVLFLGNVSAQVLGVILSVIWLVAPFIIKWLDQPIRETEVTFSEEEKGELRRLSSEIWSFYEDYVTEEDSWLPPDNVQFEPPNGVAHRTSPTNIGLYMTCALAARDFEFIDTPGLIARLERTVETIERMEKWEGHLYNWYDTVSLKPLHPIYVSTVDSGNFVGCLMTVKEGLQEWLQSRDTFIKNRNESPKKAALDIAFSEELAPTEFKKYYRDRESWVERGNRLLARLNELIEKTNFRPLYNHKANLFSLGYHVERKSQDEVLYDLMASEARQASFVAIALGQVSVSHWQSLGRTMTKSGNRPLLLSWSGTMFEYLMPWLFMRTYRNTIWESTYKAVAHRQIEYGRQRKIPFGISESGYYAFDYQMNYQYRAFGVPGLGFKRGLDQDLVVAPYATILALPFAKEEGLNSLKKIEELNGRGRYGYYEALDFTQERLPKGTKHKVISSYMAHHQGMSMLTLANLLMPKKSMYDRFHRNKQVRSAELLLQERIPKRPKLIKHPAIERVHKPYSKPVQDLASLREFDNVNTRIPEVCVLSNGKFTTMLTNSGSGFSRFEGLAVSRWREDPIVDPWGSFIYIRDITKEKLWSPSFLPCRVEAKNQRVKFGLDRVTFLREDEDVLTSMEVCVSPEWNADVRRITLTNTSEETKVLEVTTFVELALANSIADEAHTAFSKLFIRTAFDSATGCLIAGRRPREAKDKTLWSAHSLLLEGEPLGAVEYETDRSSFIGRGYTLAEPQGIRTRLRGKVGSVADPAFVMRRRVTIEPGKQVQLTAVTSVADTKDEAIEIAGRFSTKQLVERAFQLAWNRSEIELRNLHLTNREATGFQRFVGQVLYSPPLQENRKSGITNNMKGQSGLWAFGVSGERPVVLITIDNQNNMPFVVKMLTGHEYLRRLGILFDLVILNESDEGYHQQLQESLQSAALHGVDRFGEGLSGVYVIASNQLAKEDKSLLMAVSRVIFRAGGVSFISQIRLPRPKTLDPLPKDLVPTETMNKFASISYEHFEEQTKNWLNFNGWGGFSPDGKEYRMIIKDGKHLPAPWINVLANRKFGSLISELGTGYTWWKNSRECKLTPWSNDPVLDPPTETAYLRDEATGSVWSVSPSTEKSEIPYQITHGKGYTKFDHERNGIKHEMTVFVPVEDPVKIIKLHVENKSAEERQISLTYYAEWVLGVQRQANAPYIVTNWLDNEKIMTAKNTYQEIFREATAFLGIFPKLSSGNVEQISWTADRNEFIGRNRNLEEPVALGRERLSNRVGTFYESCGAIQAKLQLQPNSAQDVYILLGCDKSTEAVSMLAQKYSDAANCDKALQEVHEFWDRTLGQISVSTPSQEMNLLLNGWLLYQSLACRMWARTAFFQAGGAYGFRDQLQDSLSLLHALPMVTRDQILLHATHQYEEGDVQHWWHLETKRGIRTLFSDDLLWLPYSVSRYLEHTGDVSILEEVRPFLVSEPLKEGEHERYEPTEHSEQTGTIYEHSIRAIDKALSRIGEHGLPLMGVGDWNDGMNLVGDEGRGESVWLGWFIIDILNRFETICEKQGDTKRIALYATKRKELTEALNEHGWDGQWYRRAFTDSGQWLGSIHSEECRIDAIAQSWSVISKAAPKERAVQAMNSFDRELVDRDLSVIRLLTPAFDKTEPSPGYIQGYPPGIRENGAQYTHGVIWSIVAACQLKEGDKAMEMFQMLNPITHTRTDNEVRKYTGEPYVMAADVYTATPHEGHAGWTWYTGASGWMYQAGIEWILGIRRRGNKLYIDSCIPKNWPSFSVNYYVGKTCYSILVKNKLNNNNGKYLTLNGNQQSISEETPYIILDDDGKNHHVELQL